MPFKALAKLGKKDVLKDVKGVQTREEVARIALSVLKSRTCVRRYSPKDVSDEFVKELIIAAASAPSAGNHQPWEFIVVRDPELKEQIVDAALGQTWMLEAPVFIVICINTRLAAATYGERGERLFGIQSTAAAIENMLIAAEAFGLGSSWVGSFSEPRVSLLLQCPDYARPCAIVTVGWPAERPKKPVRQPFEEIAHLEKFDNKWKI